MNVIFSKNQLLHSPKNFMVGGHMVDHPEKPARAEILLSAAKDFGLKVLEPVSYDLRYIQKLHTERYIHYLKTIFERWSRRTNTSDEVTPGIHPDKRSCGYPKSAEGQIGFHHADLSSPINKNTWDAAFWSAQTAAHAAHIVKNGEKASYALSRPPGHHAAKDYAAGFCFFGNSAIAAEALRDKYKKIAILDIDVHHGNGTQDIFYHRNDVLTISIHADPVRFYPFFWGYKEENGVGDGIGFNINIPLERGTGDDDYLVALNNAIDSINNFTPDALVIALGLDAYEKDPLKGLAVTTEGFKKIGARIGDMILPTVIVQEGGYLSKELGMNLSSFLDGFTHGAGL